MGPRSDMFVFDQFLWIRHVLTDPKWRDSEIVAIGYVTKKCLPWASTTIKIMAFPQFRWWKPLGFSNGGYTNPPIVLMVVGIPGFGLGRYVWCVLMTWLKSNSASFEDGRSDWPTLLYNVYPGLQTPWLFNWGGPPFSSKSSLLGVPPN